MLTDVQPPQSPPPTPQIHAAQFRHHKPPNMPAITDRKHTGPRPPRRPARAPWRVAARRLGATRPSRPASPASSGGSPRAARTPRSLRRAAAPPRQRVERKPARCSRARSSATTTPLLDEVARRRLPTLRRDVLAQRPAAREVLDDLLEAISNQSASAGRLPAAFPPLCAGTTGFLLYGSAVCTRAHGSASVVRRGRYRNTRFSRNSRHAHDNSMAR